MVARPRSSSARLPDSALKAPKGKVASDWAAKIAKAIDARDSAKEARRGRPIGFPHSFNRK